MGAKASTFLERNRPSKRTGQVIEFHSSSQWKVHHEASKRTSKLSVVNFTASWCGPCQFIKPAFEELAGKYADVEFIKLDVDELDDVAQEFEVQAMPTFLLMKRGKEIDKVVGAKKEELAKKIEINRF